MSPQQFALGVDLNPFSRLKVTHKTKIRRLHFPRSPARVLAVVHRVCAKPQGYDSSRLSYLVSKPMCVKTFLSNWRVIYDMLTYRWNILECNVIVIPIFTQACLGSILADHADDVQVKREWMKPKSTSGRVHLLLRFESISPNLTGGTSDSASAAPSYCHWPLASVEVTKLCWSLLWLLMCNKF